MENSIEANLLVAIKYEIAQAVNIIIASMKQKPAEIQIKSHLQQLTDKYLRPKQVKELLSVSDNKLKEMRIKGQIPFTKIDSTYRYSERAILQMMESNSHNFNTEV